MEGNPNRAEAERLLGIAEKLLQSRDLSGSRDFAILAQETEPLLEGSDQILAVVDVLLASEKRINNHHDWYAILQLERRSEDYDLIKKHYRKLALLLHPDKNKFSFADHAFKLVAEAWAVLSNSSKKSLYDDELNLFTKVDLNSSGFVPEPLSKFPVKRSQRPKSNATDGSFPPKLSTFWTACPYCYRLYEYPRVYEECCLRCQNCQRAFHATPIPSLPPLVPGKEAYYCCWGAFPLGFVIGNSETGGGGGQGTTPSRFPNWMPPVFQGAQQPGGVPRTATEKAVGGFEGSAVETVKRKRGRPRKNPIL